MKHHMRYFAILVIAFVTSVMLVGCGPIYTTTYSFTPPKSRFGRMCVMNCLSARSSCQQICRMENQECETRSHDNAERRYEQYRYDRISHRLPVKKSVDDFYSFDDYCSSDCHCMSTYRECYQTCGGIITPHRQCVAFCQQGHDNTHGIQTLPSKPSQGGFTHQ